MALDEKNKTSKEIREAIEQVLPGFIKHLSECEDCTDATDEEKEEGINGLNDLAHEFMEASEAFPQLIKILMNMMASVASMEKLLEAHNNGLIEHEKKLETVKNCLVGSGIASLSSREEDEMDLLATMKIDKKWVN